MSLQRLSAIDAAFLALESPEVPMHVGWAARFAPPQRGPRPQFEALRRHIEARLGRAPRYRQRLAPVPLGLGDPVWVDDEDFDIANHVRRATSNDFGELVDEVLSAPLAHDRPLWELWIAERLDDGALGVIGKAHHCLVDGVAAVELMALLLDLTPEPEQPPPERWLPARQPTGVELAGDAVSSALERALGVAGAPLKLVREPWRLRDLPGEAVGAASAVLHTVAPAPRSPLNRPLSARRHLACRSRRLEDLKEIKRRFGTTVNDLLLAASAGALRTLAHERGERPERIKAMVPVSVGEHARQWGNRIAFLFLELPCEEPDPLWRLRDVHVAMRERKQRREPDGADALLDALSFAPRPLRRVASHALASPRMSNLTISNIPGPEVPLYLLGCEAERAYPVVPLTGGHGLSIGMTTVGGHACFGVYAEVGLGADADRVALALDEAIDELLACCETLGDRFAGAAAISNAR